MAQQYWTPREWLKHQADTHRDLDTREYAKALYNVVDDNWKIDPRFIGQQNYRADGVTRKIDNGFFGIGRKDHGNYSNGYSAYEVNRLINPKMQELYQADYNVWKNDPTVKDTLEKQRQEKEKLKQISTSNPYAAQQARDNALKLASINDVLSRMPSQLNRINQAEQNKYAHIEDTFNRANHGNETGWNMYKEDHDRAVKNRLDNRRRQIGIADDDFKKQRDAYSRYFSRTGSGSSSTAQFSVPTLLARASQKIRNDIEKENADSAIEQETAFNRANFDYRKNKENILTERNRQRNAAKEDFDTRRSGYWDEVGRLERQKADISNRSVADIMAAGRDATSKANRYADDAVKAGNLTEEIRFKPIEYHQAQQKDFTYDPTKTKVENTEEPKTDESLYNKYFRDEEEKKKKKGWITGVGA